MKLEIVAGALLAEDDAALAVDRRRVELQLARDLAEQEHCGIEMLGVGLGQVEHVGGGVEAGYGVGVGTELQALALEDLDHVALGHVGRAVERHMFDEVSEAALVLRFPDRTEGELQPDRCGALGGGVVHDRVFHAVGQLAVMDRGVGRDVGELDSPSVHRGRDRRGRGSRRAPARDGNRYGCDADARNE